MHPSLQQRGRDPVTGEKVRGTKRPLLLNMLLELHLLKSSSDLQKMPWRILQPITIGEGRQSHSEIPPVLAPRRAFFDRFSAVPPRLQTVVQQCTAFQYALQFRPALTRMPTC